MLLPFEAAMAHRVSSKVLVNLRPRDLLVSSCSKYFKTIEKKVHTGRAIYKSAPTYFTASQQKKKKKTLAKLLRHLLLLTFSNACKVTPSASKHSLKAGSLTHMAIYGTANIK